MGSLQAQEMAEMLDTRTAIAWHLQGNHYPPVPASMIDPCLEAIEAALAGEWLKMIALPEGVLFKGSQFAPADEIIYQHHLEPWLELDEEGLE
jgi:hypothetical protein